MTHLLDLGDGRLPVDDLQVEERVGDASVLEHAHVELVGVTHVHVKGGELQLAVRERAVVTCRQSIIVHTSSLTLERQLTTSRIVFALQMLRVYFQWQMLQSRPAIFVTSAKSQGILLGHRTMSICKRQWLVA